MNDSKSSTTGNRMITALMISGSQVKRANSLFSIQEDCSQLASIFLFSLVLLSAKSTSSLKLKFSVSSFRQLICTPLPVPSATTSPIIVPMPTCSTVQLMMPISASKAPLRVLSCSNIRQTTCLIVYYSWSRQQVTAASRTPDQYCESTGRMGATQLNVNVRRNTRLVSGQYAMVCNSSRAKSTTKHEKITVEIAKQVEGMRGLGAQMSKVQMRAPAFNAAIRRMRINLSIALQ